MAMQKTAITITTSDLLTVADAAKALRKHIVTIYRWLEDGKIIGAKFGGLMYIPASEVERLKKEINEK